MIKKFNEWISEGLWAKGIERSKTGEKRMGDLTEFDRYIETIKWVDMGHPDYLFAEYDYAGDEITGAVFKNLKFPKGISIMNSELYTWLLNNSKEKIVGLPGNKHYQRTSKTTNERVFCNIDFTVDYTCGFDGNMTFWKIMFGNNKKPFLKTILRDSELLTFKLVKEKKLNEGLWSKGIERSKTGEERLGDVIDSNVKELKPVDLGFDFLFADQNLIIEGNDRFTYADLKPYLEYIHKHGWRLMTKDEAIEASELTPKHGDILFSPYVGKYLGKSALGIKASLGDETLWLPFIISQPYTDYLIDGEEKGHELCWRISKYSKESHGRFQSCGVGYVHNKRTPVVRLVKDKPMNEGLWSKGIERSKTDIKRQEDISQFDLYLKNVEWVDMGHPDYLYAKYDYPTINDEDELTLQEIKETILPSLPDDMKFMGHDELDFLNRHCDNLVYMNEDCEAYQTRKKINGEHNKIQLHRFLHYVVEFKPYHVTYIQSKQIYAPEKRGTFKLLKKKKRDDV